MDVEFVWWGDSELTGRLSDDEQRGRMFFWFGQHEFHQEWFESRWLVARGAAGPRYTPEANVELPVVGLIKHFEKHQDSYDQIKSSAKELNRRFDDSVRLIRSVENWDTTFEQGILGSAQTRLVEEFGRVSFSPESPMSFDGLHREADAALDAIKQIEARASELANAQSEQSTTRESWGGRTSIDSCLNDLRRLRMRIDGAIHHSETVASYLNSDVLILTGEAGTGKTHLLCDIAHNRVTEGLPTLLLLGQWFTAGNVPWSQISDQLGLSGSSENEIIGALESAAQTANCRALVMIDAINEGNGIDFWRNHLGGFVESLKASPWIGLVLSVRTGYDRRLDFDSLGSDSVEVQHTGFAGHEYDATRSYCEHYGFEFPSVPLLNPEFSNPLVLKMIFEGLKRQGVRELPRGFSGITSITRSYIDSTNEILADRLDFDAQDNLVQNALWKLGKRLAKDSYLLPRDEAKRIVDSLLSQRSYSKSLFKGILDEGLLIELPSFSPDSEEGSNVTLSYERFSDYVVAQHLFESHIDPDSPSVAFAEGGGLSFLDQQEDFVRPGLVEALSVFCAESFGVELLDLVPLLGKNWWGAQGFAQSVIWRKGNSITDRTVPLLKVLNQRFPHIEDPLRVILNFSTDNCHPLNAEWLDARLRSVAMPDRDASWSVFLHETWETSSAIDRLVAWASQIKPEDDIEDRVVDLASVTLGWMFTTSHRFVRDNATKALVALLTNRLEATRRFIRRFADVDDPYVTERVYAVAYGVAMRADDVTEVGSLAEMVYDRVFASREPYPHVLLRDYARGVIERSLSLGAEIDRDLGEARPPYDSRWPSIPDKDLIEEFKPDESVREIGRRRIFSSVNGMDFGIYIIGTNSGITEWLKTSINDEPWQLPSEYLGDWEANLTPVAQTAWDRFKAIDSRAKTIEYLHNSFDWAKTLHERYGKSASDFPASPPSDDDLQNAVNAVKAEEDLLTETLVSENVDGTDRAIAAYRYGNSGSPDWFDLSEIQRYVIWRVFDLGWTNKRFDQFDGRVNRWERHTTAKAERFGKKYQWIAYHEMLAFLSDHRQYSDRYEGGDRAYLGPWQLHVRDIDPSLTNRKSLGNSSYFDFEPSWWTPISYNNWELDSPVTDWLKREDDLPDIAKCMLVGDANDGERWANLDVFLNWSEKVPAHLDPFEVGRRSIWVASTAVVLKDSDIEVFKEWWSKQRFRAIDWLDFPSLYSGEMFLGEYGWAPASDYAFRYEGRDYGWIWPVKDIPVPVRMMGTQYNAEASGYDCSIDETVTIKMPNRDFIGKRGMRWDVTGCGFVNVNGDTEAFDPSVQVPGPASLLVREDALSEYLASERLSLVWIVRGRKEYFPGNANRRDYKGELKLSGLYVYLNGELDGVTLSCFEEQPSG